MKDLINRHLYFLLGGVCVLIIGIIYIANQKTVPEIIRDGEVIFNAETISVEEKMIIVDVGGAVNSPGVYRLPQGARVEDAIIEAGGATPDANLSGINRAGFLVDGTKIIIPAHGEDIIVSATEPQGTSNSGLININTATVAELQTLPGIGAVRAESIVQFRETHGHFSDIEELMHISGIGTGIMDRIRDRVTVK